MSDRRVHARLLNGVEVVRYDRAGKWYVEGLGEPRRVTLEQAVLTAVTNESKLFLGLPGGSAFDREVGKRQAWRKGGIR